ncbi:MAG: hypothetical protein MZU91_08840 [Desulfosudis oleivorans]|nr:hypothetical protein [Desulfosudis oleivorans]
MPPIKTASLDHAIFAMPGCHRRGCSGNRQAKPPDEKQPVVNYGAVRFYRKAVILIIQQIARRKTLNQHIPKKLFFTKGVGHTQRTSCILLNWHCATPA